MTILRYLTPCLVYFFSVHFSFAQILQPTAISESPPLDNCGFDLMQQQEKEKNSKYYQLQQQLEQQAYEYLSNPPKSGTGPAKSTYTIPVVVHVVHNNGPENISDTQIETGINRLNAAFANTGFYDRGSGVDVDIEFCLARQDPQGNLTDGITRNISSLTNLPKPSGDQPLKDIVRWDTECYINIWVVKSIQNEDNGQGVAGYAYLPAAHGLAYDGIVIISSVLSNSEAEVTTLVHEMGHYLGLYHTFEGGCTNNNCFTDGDRVCDTPPDQSTSAVPCSQNVNSCSTDTNSGFTTDQFDDTQNYLDYQFLDCRHDFTSGQRDRMTFFLTTTRQSLLNCPGCQDPCPLVMELDLSANPTEVAIGENITISAITSNVNNINWYLNGELISSGLTFNYQFLELGSYQLRAEGTNALPNCVTETSITLTTFCANPPEINIIPDTVFATINQSVNIMATTQNVSDAQWYVNGDQVSDGLEFSYTFDAYGQYIVELRGNNGYSVCSTSESVLVIVTCPIDVSFQSNMSSLLIGDTVVFTANYLDAESYQWYVEGDFAGDGPSLSISFGEEGTYAISLEVTGPECVRQSNLTYLDVDDPCSYGLQEHRFRYYNLGLGRWIGKNANDEYGVLMENGFVLLDADRNIIWAKDFPDSDVLLLKAAEFPGTGDYILVGRHDETKELIVLKLSNEGNIVWTKRFIDTGPDFLFFSINVIPYPDGNVVIGAKSYADFSGNGVEDIEASFLAKIGPNGDLIWKKPYQGHDFTTISRTNDDGFLAFGLPDENTADFVLTRFDSNGDPIWTKGYESTNFELQGLYPYYYALALADNNYLLAFSSQELFAGEPMNTCFVKVNASGEVLWRKIFAGLSIPEHQYMFSCNLAANGDILFSVGNINANQGWQDIYARMDQDGNILWAYQDPFSRFYYVDQLASGEIAFLGGDQVSGFPAYIDFVNESGLAEECTINSVEYTFTPSSYSSVDLSITPFDYYTYESATAPVVENDDIMFMTTACFNEGLTAYDASLALKTIQSCGDSILVKSTICNNGNLPIWSSTPLSFYPDDPTQQSTSSFFTHPIEVEIAPDSCRNITIKIPNVDTEAIYTMINDDASLPPVFDLRNDFPVTDDYECNFFNNLASISLDEIEFPETPFLQPIPDTVKCINDSLYLEASAGFDHYLWQDGTTDRGYWAIDPGPHTMMASTLCGEVQYDTFFVDLPPLPILDLGPDLLTCQNQVVTLEAQPGFVEYRWQDGSIDRSFTAWEAGTYWVEAIDSCGTLTQVDTVIIQLDPAFSFDLGQNTSICPGESVNIAVDANYTSYQWYPSEGLSCVDCPTTTISPSETTLYTLVGTADDCFSSDTIRITVNPTYFMEETTSICEGESIDLFGQPVTEAGTYTESFQTISGCDSTVQITLEVLPLLFSEEMIQICEGETATIFGNEESVAGIYSQVFAGSTGCDSTHSVQLNVLPNVQSFDTLQPCTGQTIEVFGQTVDTSGDFEATFTGANGCDSVHHVSVTFVDEINTFANQTICEGETIELFGQVVSEPGFYEDIFLSQQGCDSIHQIQLTVLDTMVTSAFQSICQGESYLIFGNEETEAGLYSAVFTANNGCDSTHYVELSVLDTIAVTEALTICAGESIELFDESIEVAGTYSATFTASNGCDSTQIFDLTVLDTVATFETITICSGESASIFGDIISEQGPYAATFTGQNNCDSTHYVTLSVLDTFWVEESRTICQGESLEIFGQSENLAGTYSASFIAENGCDSTHNIHLVVLDTVANFESIAICEGEAIELFGQMQSLPGTYIGDFIAINGCDSTHYIELDVLPQSESNTILEICEGESVVIFGQEVSTPGTYSEVFMAANGCDSTAVIDLIVYEALEVNSEVIAACPGLAVGSIEVLPIAGQSPFNFQWGHTNEDVGLLENLEAGNYQVTVTDQNQCGIELAFVIETSPLPEFELEVVDVACFGEQSGRIEVLSDHENVLVSINGAAFTAQTIFDQLETGAYELYIREGEGCETSETVVINAPDALLLTNIDINQPTCNGTNDGSIHLITEGGVGNPTFQWDNGASGSTLSDIASGIYQVTIEDENGCQLIESITLDAVSSIDPNVQIGYGCGDGNVLVTAYPDGGVEPYDINWSTGDTGNILYGLQAGNYEVSITDGNNCSIMELVEVDFIAPLTVEYEAQNVSCFGAADGSIDMIVTGGLPPYSFSWSNGQTVEDLNNLPIGEYQVVVTSGSCAEVKTISITQPPALQVDLMLSANGNGFLNAIVEVSGGIAPYSVSWSEGSIGLESGDLIPGNTYTVSVMDANGCVYENTFTAILTAVNDLNKKPYGIKVYPNPTAGLLTLEINSEQIFTYDLKLYTAAGQIVHILVDQVQQKNTVNLTHLPAGLYFMEVRTDAFQVVEKVVITR